MSQFAFQIHLGKFFGNYDVFNHEWLKQVSRLRATLTPQSLVKTCSYSSPAKAASHTDDWDGHPSQYEQDEGEHVGGLVAVVLQIDILEVDRGPVTEHPDVSGDEPTEAEQSEQASKAAGTPNK